MRAYCIFDDFPKHEIERLEQAGIKVDVLEHDKSRPDAWQMKVILENYDIVIIGTSQKINADMWENITAPRIIGTASVGVDHIKVPDGKDSTILNTPNANAQSVAEYIVGCALMCRKRLLEGNELYRVGKNNKALSKGLDILLRRLCSFFCPSEWNSSAIPRIPTAIGSWLTHMASGLFHLMSWREDLMWSLLPFPMMRPRRT